MAYEAGRDTVNQTGNVRRGRYYGKYAGRVSRVRIYKGTIWVKAILFEIAGLEYETAWAKPAYAAAGNNSGEVHIPKVGDVVWISFRDGELRTPVYEGFQHVLDEMPTEIIQDVTGGDYQTKELPPGPYEWPAQGPYHGGQTGVPPDAYINKTRKGQYIGLFDSAGHVVLQPDKFVKIGEKAKKQWRIAAFNPESGCGFVSCLTKGLIEVIPDMPRNQGPQQEAQDEETKSLIRETKAIDDAGNLFDRMGNLLGKVGEFDSTGLSDKALQLVEDAQAKIGEIKGVLEDPKGSLLGFLDGKGNVFNVFGDLLGDFKGLKDALGNLPGLLGKLQDFVPPPMRDALGSPVFDQLLSLASVAFPPLGMIGAFNKAMKGDFVGAALSFVPGGEQIATVVEGAQNVMKTMETAKRVVEQAKAAKEALEKE